MLASNTLEFPHYKDIGWQRGRGFGAFAQVVGRTAIPFLTKYIGTAAKPVGAFLMEIAVLEVADVVSGKKISEMLPKASEDRHLENNLEVAGKREVLQSKK